MHREERSISDREHDEYRDEETRVEEDLEEPRILRDTVETPRTDARGGVPDPRRPVDTVGAEEQRTVAVLGHVDRHGHQPEHSTEETEGLECSRRARHPLDEVDDLFRQPVRHSWIHSESNVLSEAPRDAVPRCDQGGSGLVTYRSCTAVGCCASRPHPTVKAA